MSSQFPTSNDAVKKATGRTWKEWIAFLDKNRADKLSHKEIVQFLYKGGHIKSSWWCQMVTNGYEKAKGMRILGQTAEGTFQIGVSKTLPLSVDRAWELITSKEGMKKWLGQAIIIKKGQEYKTKDADGEIRVVNPKENIRMSWKPASWKKHSTLQIRTTATGKKTVINFHHEGLPGKTEREKMRTHWRKAIQGLEKHI